MNGFKQMASVKIPPGILNSIPALLSLFNRLFPDRWAFKVGWQIKANKQIVVSAELTLGKARR